MWPTNALSDKYLLNTYKGPGDTVGNKAETLALDLTVKNATFCVSKFSKWLKLIFLNIKFFNHWDQISQTSCMKENMNIADMLIYFHWLKIYVFLVEANYFT